MWPLPPPGSSAPGCPPLTPIVTVALGPLGMTALVTVISRSSRCAVLPAASVTRTTSWWGPSATAPVSTGSGTAETELPGGATEETGRRRAMPRRKRAPRRRRGVEEKFERARGGVSHAGDGAGGRRRVGAFGGARRPAGKQNRRRDHCGRGGGTRYVMQPMRAPGRLRSGLFQGQRDRLGVDAGVQRIVFPDRLPEPDAHGIFADWRCPGHQFDRADQRASNSGDAAQSAELLRPSEERQSQRVGVERFLGQDARCRSRSGLRRSARSLRRCWSLSRDSCLRNCGPQPVAGIRLFQPRPG